MKQEQISKQIIEILRRDTRGVTVQELAEKTNTSRITISIALAKLEGEEKINVRVIGNCKLNYLREKS